MLDAQSEQKDWDTDLTDQSRIRQISQSHSVSISRLMLIAMAVFCLIIFLSMPYQHFCSAIRAAGNPYSHKVHVSVANIEFNRAGQSAEIVIRVFADDLENALSQHAKRSVKIDPATTNINKQAGDLVVAYLRDKFELKTRTGRPVKLNWVGMEGQAEMFWLYVECKLPGGLEGILVRNRIFCEMFDDQVNIVNSKYQGKQIGLMFEGQDEFKAVTDQPKK